MPDKIEADDGGAQEGVPGPKKSGHGVIYRCERRNEKGSENAAFRRSLFNFAGTAGHFFAVVFAALDNPVENLARFAAQIVFKNEAVKAFDFGALAEFLRRRRETLRLDEIDRAAVFGEFNFFWLFQSKLLRREFLMHLGGFKLSVSDATVKIRIFQLPPGFGQRLRL